MIYVVGIGPGNAGEITPRASAALERCDVIVGYGTYIDLIASHYDHRKLLSSGMRQEVERCRQVLVLARSGKNVALVSGGDAGVYGMAGLLLELADEEGARDEAGNEIGIEIVPGITAACAAAAVLGAPLVHDFAVISLSDLLTPWGLIEKRLALATAADFVLCLYNPGARRRRGHLKKACDIVMSEGRSPATPSGWVRNAGREGQTADITTLSRLRETELDMFCTVIVGNSTTTVRDGRLITLRGYGKTQGRFPGKRRETAF